MLFSYPAFPGESIVGIGTVKLQGILGSSFEYGDLWAAQLLHLGDTLGPPAGAEGQGTSHYPVRKYGFHGNSKCTPGSCRESEVPPPPVPARGIRKF